MLLRNPKDTAVSYYHFYNNMPVLPSFASWDEYFAAFMNGKCTFLGKCVFWDFFPPRVHIQVLGLGILPQYIFPRQSWADGPMLWMNSGVTEN